MFSWICLFAYLLTIFTVKSEVNRPTVGVIRWDAWNLINGKYDEISFYSHRSLSPEHFHYRLPFFANIHPDGNITYNADDQAIIDQEIIYAKFAGIDYWAFDTYCAFGANCSTNSPFCAQYYLETSNRYCPENPSYGLTRYLSSQYVSLINFTFVLLGSSPCGDEFQEQYLQMMTHPQFQTVLGGRPLLYLFQFYDQEAQACAGGWNGSRRVFDSFRQKVISRGIQNPYLVYVELNLTISKRNADALGFDAISAYGVWGGTVDGAPFNDEVKKAQQWWNDSLEIDSKIILPLPTGWDPRPRYEQPVPWTVIGPEHYHQPTAEELQDFFKSSIEFTCAHRNVTEAQTVLVYAWNECSENGASLIPNLGNGTYFVRALSQVLPMSC